MSPNRSDKRRAPAPQNKGGAISVAATGSLRQTAAILDGSDIGRALTRIAHEILERNKGGENLCLIGIHTRGVPLASRLGGLIERFEGQPVRLGQLDTAGHRDDRPGHETASRTSIDFDLTGKHVILVDDVLYTGRSVRAALDALIEHGRPADVQLAVLVDRGHRELPIRADYVGKNIPTSRRERVRVHLSDTDGEEAVYIERLPEDK